MQTIKKSKMLKIRKTLEWSTRCLKITEKAAFNIASEASYVYILSRQKFFKNAQNDPIWLVFKT